MPLSLRCLITALIICSSFTVTAQKTLFTINGDAVSVDDFDYLYTKNNQTDPELYTQKSVDEYLELYINLKLKVKEAEALGIHETEAFKTELKQYRDQVADSYLVDRDVTDELIKEAYERSKKEIKCSHILFALKEAPLPEDTLLAYNTAMAIYKDIISSKIDFTEAAIKHSEDPSVKQNKGDLGYSSVFRFIYPFESAMYQTPVGQVSKPVRTRFGYHLILVFGERPALGQVELAQIVTKIPGYGTDSLKASAKVKIDAAYTALQNGQSFNAVVKSVSEDKLTNRKNGNLGWVSSGKKGIEFDKTIFNLAPGNYTKPMKIGNSWHIYKVLDKKQTGSFKEMEPGLRRKVEKNSRSQVAQKTFLEKLKTQFEFKEDENSKADVFDKFGEILLLGKWIQNPEEKWMEPLFTTNKKKFTQQDFAEFVSKNQKRSRLTSVDIMINHYYQRFVNESLMALEDTQLEAKHPEFAKLMQEFYDGILMFEYTSQQVFQKSVQDTVGLKAFYNANKGNYNWDIRVDAKKYRCTDLVNAEIIKGKLENNDFDNLFDDINKTGKIKCRILKEAKFEKGDDEIIDAVKWQPGHTEIIKHDSGDYYIVKIIEVLKPEVKSFNEAKTDLVNNYQKELSENMLTNLKSKYKVKINKKVLKSLYK